VSTLDGFYATWADARRTFGEGTRVALQFDASAKLHQLSADVASAAPGSLWSGAAASAYEAKNATHRAVVDRTADLDQRPVGRSTKPPE
jgi:hypothetical protein